MTAHGFAALVVTMAAGATAAQPSDPPRGSIGNHSPEADFSDALRVRSDSVQAARLFRLAANGFDEQWQAGRQTPALALNRGRAHFLAGNLPQAIRAFRDGLAIAPWNADLQAGLAHSRSLVAYPDDPNRPDPLFTLRHRVSPADLFAAAVVGSLLATVGLAARFTTRPGWSIPVAVVGMVGMFVVAAVATKIAYDTDAERSHPVLVVAAEVALRSGNGTAFDARLPSPLPRGTEVRELHRRGGWVQVELSGGAVGWLPESALI